MLIANDAAGEGVNLQRGAHLMVNYDLPWNPNRLEQRFGRIHRIGQTEVCHLWNLVAANTREGEVYRRLLEKLEEAREALGGEGLRRARRAVRGPGRCATCWSRPSATATTRSEGRAVPAGRWRRRRREDREAGRRAQAHLRRARPAFASPRSARRWSGPRRGACSRTSSAPSSRRRSRGLAAGSGGARPAATRSRACPGVSATGIASLGGVVPISERYERVCFDKAHRDTAQTAGGPHNSGPRPARRDDRRHAGGGGRRAEARRHPGGRGRRARHSAPACS